MMAAAMVEAHSLASMSATRVRFVILERGGGGRWETVAMSVLVTQRQ